MFICDERNGRACKRPPRGQVRRLHSENAISSRVWFCDVTPIEAPILIAPNWELPFEMMCDASDIVVGAVLGQIKNKVFHFIYYASKTLDVT